MQDRIDQYVKMKDYVEREKPYWLFLDAQRGQEMRYGLFNYFPGAHYKKAIDEALEAEARDDLDLEPDGGQQLPDGGRLPERYFWYDPSEDEILHRSVDGRLLGLFANEDDADWFAAVYTEIYGVDDPDKLEKYVAHFDLVDRGAPSIEQAYQQDASRVETFADKNPELKHRD